MIEGIEFVSTGAVRWVTGVALVVVFVLCVVAWVRSAFRPAIGVLEALRLVLVAGVLFALNQPERVETEPATDVPVVAVLWDDSASMDTRDVVPQGAIAAAPRSRREWLEENLDIVALEASLAGRYRLVSGPLSTDAGEDAGADADADADAVGSADGGTDLAGPLSRLLDDQSLRAVVLVGDGDWNSGGNPADVAMKYRMLGVPVMTTTVGSRTALPDVELLPLEPPAFALVGKPLAVPFAIRSAMDRDLTIPVTLKDSDGQAVVEDVLLRARSMYEGSLTITPLELGSVTLTASVPVQPGELDESNNVASAEIDVREESLRVLLVESFPRWEYRYMRNAMVRDPGVEVDCLLFHPDLKGVGGGPHYLESFPTRPELSEYDVVFLGDVGNEAEQLTREQCSMIKGLVAEQASGLILMPGYSGRQFSLYDTDIEPLIPVELDPVAPHGYGSIMAHQLVLTESGRRSTLTKLAPDERSNANLWEDLPGFQWHAPVVKARAGSTVLAVHSDRDDGLGRVPLLVTKNYGTGKVLFMGTDGAWRWREGIEDRVHYRFWRQVVRWMAYQRKMNAGESMRLFYSPDRPGVRSLTTLYANVMDGTGAPLLDADLSARVESPSGRISRLVFAPDEGEWGLYRSTFRAQEPGDHIVTLTCADTQEQLVADLAVAGVPLERLGMPARHDVMAELARISRGDVLSGTDLSAVEERLLALEEPPLVTRRTRLWSHPLLAATLIVLMACFWTGRKLAGRF